MQVSHCNVFWLGKCSYSSYLEVSMGTIVLSFLLSSISTLVLRAWKNTWFLNYATKLEKYLTTASTTWKIIWLHLLLSFSQSSYSYIVHCHNQYCIEISHFSVFHKRTTYIDSSLWSSCAQLNYQKKKSSCAQFKHGAC